MLIMPARILSRTCRAAFSSSLLSSYRHRVAYTTSCSYAAAMKRSATAPVLVDDTDAELEKYLKRVGPTTCVSYLTADFAEPNPLQPRVLIYDGICNLCHGGVKWIIKVDKYEKIKFCCLQSRTAEPYLSLCGLTREDVSQRFLFIEGQDLYHQGSTAALRVLSYLPPPYCFLTSLSVIPSNLRDVVYDYVAKNRYDWFGKGDQCLVLRDLELLERFIDREELMDQFCRDKSMDGDC